MITIGIDLGTTNSCMAFHDGHGAQIIEAPSGMPTMPSVVAVEGGQFIVGSAALRRISRKDPQFIFSNIKRHIGRQYVEGEDYGVQGGQIIRGPDGMRAFRGPDDEVYTPERLSAEILKVMKAQAEARIGQKVERAVITVPAGFDNTQIRATEAAGKMAGFKKVITMTEPEAAVLAYGLNRKKFSRVVVFDLGGGTFDVVLAEAGLGGYKPIAKDGYSQLGGADWDRQIISYIVERYKEAKGRDLRQKPISMLKIAPEAESAKRELTEAADTAIEIVNVHFDAETGMMDDISEPMSREMFNEMTQHLVDQTISITRRMMEYSERLPQEVHDVLLVGGMTRVPAVRQAVESYFGPERVRDTMPQDLAVAIGAAIKAAEIDGRIAERTVIEDVTAMAFGLEVTGNRFVQVLPKGTPYGTLKTVRLHTDVDGQNRIPVCILQGDHPQANQNSLLARYDHAVTPAPATVMAVDLDLMVDENGILLVTGQDSVSGEPFEVIGL